MGKIVREKWVRGSVSSCGLIIYVPLFSYIQMIKWQLLKFRWKIFKCLFEHASWPATTATIIIMSRMVILWRNCASLKLSARKYEISARQLNFLNLLKKWTAAIFHRKFAIKIVLILKIYDFDLWLASSFTSFNISIVHSSFLFPLRLSSPSTSQSIILFMRAHIHLNWV